MVGGRAARAEGDVDFAVEAGDLLADGVVRGLEDGAAEDDGPGGFEVGGGDCGDLKGHFGAAADDEGGEEVVGVHNVEFADSSDELIVQSEDDVAFLQRLIVFVPLAAGCGSAVDFADHK